MVYHGARDPINETILVVEDELNMRRVLRAMLSREGYHVQLAKDGVDAVQQLMVQPSRVVLADLKMPRMDGMELLEHIQQHHPAIPVVILTAFGTVDTAVEALKKGAFDYITKPFDQDDLLMTLRKAVKSTEWNVQEIGAGREDLRIIGQSPPMMKIYETIEKVADTPTTILLTGETGTGKELIAKALHLRSSRHRGPFIHINCGAIPETLVESELFGHEKGAFTGAVSTKPGRFELANGGTLFLDEIGEISREMQVKLLHVLQEQSFERVGGLATIRVNVRLIAASNRDLYQGVKAGDFREDLFYRLNVMPIHVPPLRVRREDIPLLVDYFLQKFNNMLNRNVREMEDRAMEALISCPWPGNIRELENLVERLVVLASGPVIRWEDLPAEVRGDKVPQVVRGIGEEEDLSLRKAVEQKTTEVERHLISRALSRFKGNITRAAEYLGVSRRGLQMKMRKYGLRK
ncbi:MAG: sigma-54-dependent Fis family transcriptional regulator [Deltaproteobacteria bacterium]|nr:sigma-54-dependent Fis family transcriptional regulator [Deltaproteobacteria bacterium]MBW2307988.1 sigma-54-dependent Fis family transcriptional regulator [Deltaproteobacteria bacterium]